MKLIKTSILCGIFLLAASCKTIKGELGGVYFSKYDSDFYCLINLNDRDSTFEYESNALFKGKYSGHWEVAKDSVYLYFDGSENPIDYIKGHNLYGREIILKVNRTNLYSPFLRMKFKKDTHTYDSQLRNNGKVLLLER